MDVIKEIQNAHFFIPPLPEKTVEAMAYIPYQNASKLYSPEQGMRSGTMFPELNKPFCPEAVKGGEQDD